MRLVSCKVGLTRGGLCEVDYVRWVMRGGSHVRWVSRKVDYARYESPSEMFHTLIFAICKEFKTTQQKS